MFSVWHHNAAVYAIFSIQYWCDEFDDAFDACCPEKEGQRDNDDDDDGSVCNDRERIAQTRTRTHWLPVNGAVVYYVTVKHTTGTGALPGVVWYAYLLMQISNRRCRCRRCRPCICILHGNVLCVS